MFVAINLIPSGSMTSRADLLGFSDDQVEAVRCQNANPALGDQINVALQVAARALFSAPGEGSVH
jgi:hypothetical protein